MVKQRTFTHICAGERVWVLSLCGILISIFALYMYFVTTSVVQVVVRQEINQEITQVKSQISALEAEYMSLQYGISDEIALHEGYVDVDEKVYIQRAPSTLVLSYQQ